MPGFFRRQTNKLSASLSFELLPSFTLVSSFLLYGLPNSRRSTKYDICGRRNAQGNTEDDCGDGTVTAPVKF